MRIVRLVGICAVALSLVGCAATGPKYSEVAAKFPPVAAGKGRVYFYRDTSLLGAAVTADVNLNGKVVGKSERSSFFYVDQTAGDCTVTTSTEVEKRLTFTLAPSETKYVRTSVSLGAFVGRINPELVSADQAKQALPELAYTGGNSQTAAK